MAVGLGLAVLATTTVAWAAETKAAPTGAASEVIFLTEIILLIVCGRLLGEAMQRIGQPTVMGQLLAGILLGPSVFGAFWPDAQKMLFAGSAEQKAMIEAVSQLGILMLLLLAGMETDLSLVRRVRKAAFSVSVTGIVIPFVCGFALGQMLPDSLIPKPEERLITSLFLGTALSISSVKIVATVVREMNFLRRNVGQIILASAIIDDTLGWIIIAVIFGLATYGGLDWPSLAKSVVGTLIFLGLSFTVGRRLVFKVIRWTNDNFESEAAVIAVIIVIMGVMALTTNLIGVHTVLGAFVAGILVGESPILTKQIDEQLRGITAGLFMPVFFGLAGLHADLTILKNGELALLTLGLILIASVGKAGGAFFGGWFSGLDRKSSTALAFGMNARGSTEVIVATIGLSMGVLNQNLFTMIVAMAFVTTMAMPPTLRWALHRLPLRAEERERLAREEFEKKGFVANLERVLLAVDESAKGKFASRLAGLLAGTRGMPVTVLRFPTEEPAPAALSAAATKSKAANKKTSAKKGKNGSRNEDDAEDDEAGEDEAEEKKLSPVVAEAAEQSKPVEPAEEKKGAQVEVIERAPKEDEHPTEAVAKEARKGYSILVVGIDPTVDPKGGFDAKISHVVRDFDGPLAVTTARGKHEAEPLESSLNILVPVTGSGASRRGAEVAVALAQAAGAPVTALVVTPPGAAAARPRFGAPYRDDQEILREVKMLAKFYKVKIKTAVRTNMSAEEAILRQARFGGHDLIVLGVSRRPGDQLSFGSVAGALLEGSDRSLLFVSS